MKKTHVKSFKLFENNEGALPYKFIGLDKSEIKGITNIEIYTHWSLDLPNGKKLTKGWVKEAGYEFALILDQSGEIEVAIYQYEISNPDFFGDIIVVPGHDSITLYNYVTGEDKIMLIR